MIRVGGLALAGCSYFSNPLPLSSIVEQDGHAFDRFLIPVIVRYRHVIIPVTAKIGDRYMRRIDTCA